jgi:hypothetical protein
VVTFLGFACTFEEASYFYNAEWTFWKNCYLHFYADCYKVFEQIYKGSEDFPAKKLMDCESR